jgi:hypothetical protein
VLLNQDLPLIFKFFNSKHVERASSSIFGCLLSILRYLTLCLSLIVFVGEN